MIASAQFFNCHSVAQFRNYATDFACCRFTARERIAAAASPQPRQKKQVEQGLSQIFPVNRMLPSEEKFPLQMLWSVPITLNAVAEKLKYRCSRFSVPSKKASHRSPE